MAILVSANFQPWLNTWQSLLLINTTLNHFYNTHTHACQREGKKRNVEEEEEKKDGHIGDGWMVTCHVDHGHGHTYICICLHKTKGLGCPRF